ncbi:hypothetical protein SanaruYs_36510 [Chryseotalea sanaruensis]|uniref:Uncharacterized protein n=1 Tax=Chryseotalea sanaruensis TaxID=2482724 RepID=A0A401UEW1_9BACT|nr:hypothetical protein [Chryseotalea sanaruensis]GCC53407.1 hypothetical protein SanaruYs_36510 [Chryseotalea sanaruensis]
MRILIPLALLISQVVLAQNKSYQLTSKDTLITYSISQRNSVTGPMHENHAAELENLVETVFKALPFPAQPYTLFRSNSSEAMQIGKHSYDDIEHHTFLLYNLDSASLLNLKARTRFGTLALSAHMAGHHGFNHLMPWLDNNSSLKILRSDYMAGWLLAKFNASESELTKTLEAMLAGQAPQKDFPSLQERSKALKLGYTMAKQNPASPLKSLENNQGLDKTWERQWSRCVEVPATAIGLDASIVGKLNLDNRGQLLLEKGGKNIVIARAMPSKDTRYAYVLYDNTFHYWLIGKDGTLSTSDGARELGNFNIVPLREK